MTPSWREELVHSRKGGHPERHAEGRRQEPHGIQREQAQGPAPLGRKDPLQWCRLGTSSPGSSSVEKVLGVLVDIKLGMSQLCVLAA